MLTWTKVLVCCRALKICHKSNPMLFYSCNSYTISVSVQIDSVHSLGLGVSICLFMEFREWVPLGVASFRSVSSKAFGFSDCCLHDWHTRDDATPHAAHVLTSQTVAVHSFHFPLNLFRSGPATSSRACSGTRPRSRTSTSPTRSSLKRRWNCPGWNPRRRWSLSTKAWFKASRRTSPTAWSGLGSGSRYFRVCSRPRYRCYVQNFKRQRNAGLSRWKTGYFHVSFTFEVSNVWCGAKGCSPVHVNRWILYRYIQYGEIVLSPNERKHVKINPMWTS